MKPKQLIALSIITLVIVGALFAIHKYTQKKEEKKSLEKRIFTQIDWNEIHQIVFQSADEREPVVLERVQLPEKDKSGPGKWKIVSPIQDEVNQTKIESIWSTLKELESLESFTLPPDADLKEYGLAPPTASVELKNKKGNTIAVLYLGSKNKVTGNIYAMKSKVKTLFTLAGYRGSTLMPRLNDLRNKDLTDLRSTDIIEINIERKNLEPKMIEIKKENGLWIIHKPYKVLADSGKLFSTTSTIEYLEAKDFIDDQPEDLSQYGLDDPPFIVKIRAKKGETFTLLLGKKTENNDYYAQVEGKKRVITVKSEDIEDFTKDMSIWESKNPVDIDYYNLTHMNIFVDGKTYTLERTRETGETFEEHWYLIKNGKKTELKLETIDELTQNIDYAESDIVNRNATKQNWKTYGLDKPFLILEFKEKEKTVQKLYLANNPENDKEGFGVSELFPNVIYKYKQEDWKDIQTAWENVKKLLENEGSSKLKESKDERKQKK